MWPAATQLNRNAFATASSIASIVRRSYTPPGITGARSTTSTRSTWIRGALRLLFNARNIMKDSYTRDEVITICKKVKREAAKMEMIHIIAKLNMSEAEARKYYALDDVENRIFTMAILTIDIEQYL